MRKKYVDFVRWGLLLLLLSPYWLWAADSTDTLTVTVDKAVYKPGDTITITVTAPSGKDCKVTGVTSTTSGLLSGTPTIGSGVASSITCTAVVNSAYKGGSDLTISVTGVTNPNDKKSEKDASGNSSGFSVVTITPSSVSVDSQGNLTVSYDLSANVQVSALGCYTNSALVRTITPSSNAQSLSVPNVWSQNTLVNNDTISVRATINGMVISSGNITVTKASQLKSNQSTSTGVLLQNYPIGPALLYSAKLELIEQYENYSYSVGFSGSTAHLSSSEATLWVTANFDLPGAYPPCNINHEWIVNGATSGNAAMPSKVSQLLPVFPASPCWLSRYVFHNTYLTPTQFGTNRQGHARGYISFSGWIDYGTIDVNVTMP